MRFFLFLLLLLSVTFSASALERDSLFEQVLDTVLVQAKHIKRQQDVNIATRTSNINQDLLIENQTRSLSEVLSQNSVVYIKSLGQGAFATCSFRGTSAAHTQVTWNGILINPPMSSTFDFSQIPAFFTDNIDLYHGNSSLKNGTGGLGGSINISNTANWHDPSMGRAFFETASNKTYTGAAMIRLKNEKVLYQGRFFYQQSENNYRYLNKVLQKDPFYERRKESAYNQGGIMQELYYRINDNQTLTGNVWYQFGERDLPQPIIVNVTQHEKQKEDNVKAFLGYDLKKGRHALSVKTAYLLNSLVWDKWYDNEAFSGSHALNQSQTFQVKADYVYTPSSELRFNMQGAYTYDFVNATDYSLKGIDRNVFSLQGNFLWNLNSVVALQGQIMGELNDHKFAPTFSTAFLARIIPDILTAKANISYNYKFPGMNDLYWKPGGNINLKPEKGFSYDATLSFTSRPNQSFEINATASYYLMNIDNWIMWLPTSNWFWEPRNVQNVLSHGLELHIGGKYRIRKFLLESAFNYTYSPSVNRERNFEEDNTYRKQLPYVPLHKGNIRVAAHYKGLFCSYQIYHTGIRYTSADESYKTNAYTVHDIEAGYRIKLKKHYSITPKLSVSNLFNAYYESTEYYPMPLRYIAASVTFNL